MIAKIVPSPKGGGRFGDLGAYIGAGRRRAAGLGPPGQGAEWSRLGSYVLDQANGGEKVAASWTRNLGSDDLAWGIKMVEATQALARADAGGREGKTLHLVVSFAPGERLDIETMKGIEERLAKRLGLEDHQRIAGIHRNTDCWHMHIAINKVHPETLRTVTPWQSHNKLRALCREIEQEHGLTQTRLTRDAERYLSEGAARMEIHEGRESFTTWAKENGRAALLAARDSGQGWQGVHEAAARLGMEIKPRGAGLVLSPAGVAGYGIKASAVDRGLGIKAMTDRLGEYEPPQSERPLPKAEQSYTSEALQKSAAAKELSAAFEKARTEALAERDRAFKAMQAEQGDYRQRVEAWAKAERERIKHGTFSAFDPDKYGKLKALAQDRRRMMAEAREARRKAGETIRETHQIPTWQIFLERKAQAGDEIALGILRERQAQSAVMSDTIIAAETATEARSVVKIGARRTVRKDGTVAYNLRDGGVVLDRAGQIEITAESKGAAEFGLELAENRFGQVKLNVKGTDQFKSWMVEAAAREGAAVTFADAAMEQRRQELAVARTQNDLIHATRTASASQGMAASGRDDRPATVVPLGQREEWRPGLPGVFTYAGQEGAPGGGAVLLWEQGGQTFVEPANGPNRYAARFLDVGEAVTFDKRGQAQEVNDRGHGR